MCFMYMTVYFVLNEDHMLDTCLCVLNMLSSVNKDVIIINYVEEYGHFYFIRYKDEI